MKIYFFILLCLVTFISPYMMGIDLGSEYFKVTVIKPGKPFMMMENLLSKTKTENALGLKDDEITYSYDSLAKKAKAPANIFNYFSEYLGRRHNDSFVTEYMKDFFQSYNISAENETETITFNFKYNNKDEQLSIVELYSMIFDYIKYLSEKYTKIEMTDAFITIPSFFDYQHRQAIADAIKISKLRLAGVVSDNLAAAVQFQLKKVFYNETFYIIYNMGSSYTQSSLVSFRTIFETKNNKTVDIGNEIKVYGETYDEKLGGKYFDKNLCLLMMEKFDKLPLRKGKKSVIGNKKIYEKIRPSAIKYKEVLSANKEAFITVIGVEGGDDLQTKITREEFEEVNRDLINKVYAPIEHLLNKTNMTINNISQIELIGGSIRIPAIQEELKNRLGNSSDILGIHMNGDDSIAFGAAYMCANSSKNFVGQRKTFIQNGANERFKLYLSNLENKTNPFIYCKEGEENQNGNNQNCVKKLQKDKEIFPLRHRFNSKRSIEIEQDTNVLVKITEEFPGKFEERDLKYFEITGVPEAMEQMKKDNATSLLPKINIKFIYTKGGQIELESFIKYKYPKYFSKDFYYIKNITEPLPKEKIDEINEILNKSIAISEYEMKNLIENTTVNNKTKEENSTNEEKDDEDKTDFNNNTNINDTENNSTKAKKAKKNKKKKKEEKEKPVPSNYTYNNTLYITTKLQTKLKNLKKIGQKKEEEEKIFLKIKETHLLYPKPMNQTQIQNSIKKIKRLIEIDTNRTKLIEKRNVLEALIFNRKEYLDGKYAKIYLKPEEIDNATIYINNKSSWYEDDGYAAPYDVLNNEIENITKYFKPYEKRQKRHYDRAVAINKFFTDLNSTEKRIVKVLKEKPWTEEYFNTTFLKEYNETMEWFNITYMRQERTPHWEPEVLDPYILNLKMDNLRHHLYEMTMMKNLTEEEKAKEKEKKKKKKKNKFGDIDLDDILNKESEEFENLFKKNFSRVNDTINNNKTETTKDIKDSQNKDKKKDDNKKDDKKESDL